MKIPENRGDLMLAPDGTYELGGIGVEGAFVAGRYVTTDTDLQLLFDGPAVPLHGTVAADSVTLPSMETVDPYCAGVTLDYAASPVPTNSLAGTRWVLRTINGSAAQGGSDLLRYAFTDPGVPSLRLVSRVAYDTLAFKDPVFFQHSRAEIDSSRLGDPGYLVGGTSRASYGGYRTTSAQVILAYGSAATAPVPDTLSVNGPTLIRRSQFWYYVNGNSRVLPIEEHHERIP